MNRNIRSIIGWRWQSNRNVSVRSTEVRSLPVADGLLDSRNPSEERSRQCLIGISAKDFVVDQTVSLHKGKHFRPIDKVELVADTETIIQVTNSNTVGFVMLDALQLLPIKQESK